MPSIQVPNNWKSTNLVTIAEVRYGKARPKEIGNIPVIGSGGIYGHTSKALIDFPTIVIGRKGTAGIAWLQEAPCWASDTTFYLNWRDELVDYHYLYYHFLFRPLSGEHARTTLPSILKQDLENYPLNIPPLPEQRAISHVLRTVQQAREARLWELELERERKAALMGHLFALTDRRVMPLDECAFIQTGVTKGRKLDGNNTTEVPYLRVANVQDGYLDLNEIQTIEIRRVELERFLLQTGDILLTEGGDFDKLGRGFIWQGQIPQCIHQNHIFAVRVDKRLLLPEYLAYLIQSEYGKDYFLSVAHRTTHLACINSTKLKAFPTLVPDLERQKEIADTLSACDSKIATLEREAHLTEELFRAMLEELMTSRISTTL